MPEANKCNVCQKRSNQKCAGCQNVFYCSKVHQKLDWKQHKTVCQPFKVASDSVLGRYLMANRDLNAHEIILKEKPLIYGPAQDTVPVCLGCNQEISLENYRLCSKCGWPTCSEDCERNPCHWPECYYTVESGEKINIENFGSPNPFYQCIIVLRCLYQKARNPSLWKKLNHLESHCKERQSTERYYNEKLMAKELIHKLFKLEKEFSIEEILKMCGVIMINAHEVPLSEPSYIAIYEKTSMFENDCRSNCSKSFTCKGEVLITSGVNINKEDHLSICYADPLWSTPKRRNFLYNTKFFWCRCDRCTDPTEFGTYFSGVSCQCGACDGCLLPKSFIASFEDTTSWSCTKCPYSVSNDLVATLLNKIEEDVLNLDKNNPTKCKTFLNKLKRILPQNNYHLVDVKLALSQLIGQLTFGGMSEVSNADLELKRSLCEEILELTKKLIPSEKRVRGLILFEQHATLAEIARRKSNNFRDLDRAQSILKSSALYLQNCIEMLQFEPYDLPEGKICKQAKTNMEGIKQLFN